MPALIPHVKAPQSDILKLMSDDALSSLGTVVILNFLSFGRPADHMHSPFMSYCLQSLAVLVERYFKPDDPCSLPGVSCRAPNVQSNGAVIFARVQPACFAGK